MKKYTTNALGLAVLPDSLHEKLFEYRPYFKRPMVERIRPSLELHNYSIPLSIPEGTPNVEPVIPDLPKADIADSFEFFAETLLGDFEEKLFDFRTAMIPDPPTEYHYNSGWTRYSHNGEPPRKVEYPLEEVMALDSETLVKRGSYPIMCAAVTKAAWYIWLHPSLCSPVAEFEPIMIPVGYGKIIIGHNVSYDRIRLREEYSLEDTGNRFLCTMSMHTCVAGLAAEQRTMFRMFQNRKKGKPAWFYKGAPKNLIDCYNYHVFGDVNTRNPLAAKKEDKEIRETFVVAPDHRAIVRKLPQLISYMLSDVHRTRILACALYPKYRNSCPSKVTLAAAIAMGSSILPVKKGFHEWRLRTDTQFHKISKEIEDSLMDIARDTVKSHNADTVKDDPWLSNLDWTPAKSGKNKGLPLWWRKKKSKGISSKSREAPYLLRMTWLNMPLIYIRNAGWCVRLSEEGSGKGLREIFLPASTDDRRATTGNGTEIVERTKTDTAPEGFYGRLPHKKGAKNNVGNPLAKDYIYSFENGTMSGSKVAKGILKKAANISYWSSCRKRVMAQIVINDIIIPCLEVNGTGTRRPIESLWLTTTSSKIDKLGSELKAMVRSHLGYLLFGADFAGQEMSYASRLADSRAGILGGTPVGVLVNTGTKSEGTDAHSQLRDYLNKSLAEKRDEGRERTDTICYQDPVTRQISATPLPGYLLSISDGMTRQESKQPNFAILYQSGVAGLTGTFQKERVEWPESDCRFLAQKSILLRKGSKDRKTGLWVGGTDSEAFNAMADYANAPVSRTAVLDACISTALRSGIVGRDFMTSRCNACIQGSGQDLTHSLIVALAYLAKTNGVKQRFIFSYHDEILCLAPDNEILRAVQCLNVAHLYVWALVSFKLNLDDVPANSAWFPDSNIDIAFRKEVDIKNITPSSNEDLPDGVSVDHSIFEDGKFFLSSKEESEKFTAKNLKHLIDYVKTA